MVIVTGLLSYIAYGPQFGQAIPGDVGFLHLPWFDWPASPSWLYRLTQGLHVGLGLVLVPVVLAKLWSVVPKLFAWPPVRSPAQALERLSLLLLVGGILFEIVTGLLNIQYDYVFGFSFYAAHYVGAWVFIGGFVAHVALKLPHMWRALRSRSLRTELRTSVAATPSRGAGSRRAGRPRPGAADHEPPRALALVGGGSLLVAALTAGQTIGPLRGLAVLLPRGRTTAAADGGPNDFPVNKTFVASGIDPGALDAWTLELTGGAALRPARPRGARRAARAHRHAADRLRRGLVDRADAGAGCGCAIWRRSPGSPPRRPRSCARSSRVPSRRRRSPRGRCCIPTRCSPWRSTGPRSRRTTGSRRG